MKTRYLHLFTAVFSLIFVVASCRSEGGGKRRGNEGGEEEPQQSSYTENEAWTITYSGREEIVENGSHLDVENFQLTSSDNQSYYFDVVSTSAIQQDWSNKLEDFFDDIARRIRSGDISSDWISTGSQSFQFDRMRAGEWIAYAIGIDKQGRTSGDYAALRFRINAENPTDAYRKWLGEWFIGDDNIKYRINISTSEANYAYKITGWEAGDKGSADAKDYSFECLFDRWSGSLLFVSQYLGSFTTNNNRTYDTCLYGNIYYNGSTMDEGQYFIEDDVPIAEATFSPDGKSAQVDGCSISLLLDNEVYNTSFISMQLMDLANDNIEENNVLIYNDVIPSFPLVMLPAVTTASTHGAALEVSNSAPLAKASYPTTRRRLPSALRAAKQSNVRKSSTTIR